MSHEHEDRLQIVLTTIDSRPAAETLAFRIVENRLAACVNVIGGVHSVYWWKGGVETAAEHLLVIKTTPEMVEGLRSFLEEKHPYDLPEIVVITPDATSDEYAEWVGDSTKGSA
jgi:periplasmic divalent cation tolerance protein